MSSARSDQPLRSEFLQMLTDARLSASGFRSRRHRRAGRQGRTHHLRGLRLHGQVAACRQSDVDHDAALAAGDPGNKPIVLMGGGTTRVGDPSGKDESRQMLTLEGIEANKDSLKATFGKVLHFGDGLGRRPHGRQRGMAGAAELHRLSARRGEAFLGQPHAVDGQRQDSGSTASTNCRSSNSTTCACRPTTSSN